MKIELQCGDTIAIPEGCKAQINGNEVIIEKVQEFKDGDILVALINGRRCNTLIYKGKNERGLRCYYAGLDMVNKLHINKFISSSWYCDKLLYATEEEKQQLFDKMKEKKLKWNAEEKRVEKIRRRAKEGEEYFYIGKNIHVCKFPENNDVCDNILYDALNYFRTSTQAEEAAKRMKEVLRKYHDEIGE